MTVEGTVTNMLGSAFWEQWDAVDEDGVGSAERALGLITSFPLRVFTWESRVSEL